MLFATLSVPARAQLAPATVITPALAPRGRSGAASSYPREQMPFTNESFTNLNPALPTFFVAGDSTAARNLTDIQRGWGAMLVDYFDTSKVNLVNYAQAGASFPSFYASRWPQIVAALKPGDFVVIEFGHNGGHLPGNGEETSAPPPAPVGPNAEEIATINAAFRKLIEQEDPSTKKVFDSYPTLALASPPAPAGRGGVNHTYGWYVRQYASEVRAKGATPIISTTTVRNMWTNPNAKFNDSTITSQNENYNPKDDKVERWMGGPMLTWTQQAVDQDHLLLIDHSAITADLYEKMGRESVAKLFIQDHTHTTTDGAVINAETFIAGLKTLPNMPLNNYLNEKGKAIPAAVLSPSAPKPSLNSTTTPSNP
jgi:lysophospholipase L1-like esterase